MRTWSPAPYTGFGDNAATSVKFGILRQNGQLPDWSGGPRLVQLAVANSNRTIDQNLGRGPYVIALRLWFAGIAELERLDALQGRRATLRYRWGLTMRIGGEHERIGEGDYLALSGVKLVRLESQRVNAGGTAEASATFQRAWHEPEVPSWGPYPPAPEPMD